MIPIVILHHFGFASFINVSSGIYSELAVFVRHKPFLWQNQTKQKTNKKFPWNPCPFQPVSYHLTFLVRLLKLAKVVCNYETWFFSAF